MSDNTKMDKKLREMEAKLGEAKMAMQAGGVAEVSEEERRKMLLEMKEVLQTWPNLLGNLSHGNR